MRTTVTDQFLWDLYNIGHATHELMRFVLNPNAIKWMPGPKNPVFEKYRKEKGAREFAKLIYYLKRKNYIRMKSLEGKKAVMLTKTGIDKVLQASFTLEKKQSRKDGKWIMLIFDMPAKYKKGRQLMRGILRNLGYKVLQHSVWVCPYDVSEKTEQLLQLHDLERYVKIFLIEKL